MIMLHSSQLGVYVRLEQRLSFGLMEKSLFNHMYTRKYRFKCYKYKQGSKF